MEYSEMQKKGFEIAKAHEHLPMQDRLNIIAKTFGCKTASIVTKPCFGKYRGNSDIGIAFDNGTSLFVGIKRTPQAKTAKIQNECINDTLARYNPEIVHELKSMAAAALSKREAQDNAVAAEKGLKPYTFLNVELNDGSVQDGHYLGWYYVTLEVDGKIFGHVETGLKYDIARGEVSENISGRNYFVAGALREDEVDFVFDNVAFSSSSGLYKVVLSDEARLRAEKTLEQKQQGIHVQPEPPPVRGVLSDKPIGAGDQLSLNACVRPSAMDKLAAKKVESAKNDAEKPASDKPNNKSHAAAL